MQKGGIVVPDNIITRNSLMIGTMLVFLLSASLTLPLADEAQARSPNSNLHIRIVRDVQDGRDWGPQFEFSTGRTDQVIAVGMLRGWGEQRAIFDIRPVPKGESPFAANWEDPIGIIAADKTISSVDFSQRDLRAVNGWKWKAYCFFDYGEPEDYYLGEKRGPAQAVQLILEGCPSSSEE